MEYFRLEMHNGHLLGVLSWNGHSKFENGILIDSLPDKVNTFPVCEWRAGVVWTLLGRHQKDSDWRIFLEKLVLEFESLQPYGALHGIFAGLLLCCG